MGKKILLADDSITIQKVIELTFSDEDFDVVTVGNGRLAIEKLHETRPDVVLCDIIMPEKDGYEVCEYIKKDPTLAHIPVLLLTGAFEPFDQERATKVGCDGYLAKPFEPQTLITRVKALLAQASVPHKPGPAAAAAPTHVEFEPVQEVQASTAIGQEFEPLAASGDFEPLDAVAFEPLPPSDPEPEPLGEYVSDVPPASPTETIVPRAAPAPPIAPSAPMESVAFIPEEPVSAPPPVPPAASTAAFEPMFVPEDEPSAPVEPELEEYVAEVSPEEPPAIGETLSPTNVAWAGATVEVPLEERAQASVEAAYGNDFGSGPETMLDDVTLEPDSVGSEPEPAPDQDLATLSDQHSIFEAMGLDPEAGAKVQAELAETEPGIPESLPESVEWEEDAAESSAPDASSSETAGAELLLDDDLSAPGDMAAAVEAAAASVEAEEPEIEPELEQELEPLGTPPPPTPPVQAVPLSAMAAFSAPPAVPVAPAQALPLSAMAAFSAPPLGPATPPAPALQEESFEEVLPQHSEPVPAGQPSRAAEVAVPVDMVAQIAQRVVGQISEKVIREIAWEIIPELAEALIKKEIERLKAELDQLPR